MLFSGLKSPCTYKKKKKERERKRSLPRLMILRCRRRRLEGARIARGLNSLLESCDANGVLKREIYAREKEQLPSESIVLDIACFFFFFQTILTTSLKQTSSTSRPNRALASRLYRLEQISRLFSPNLYLSRDIH